MDKNFGMRLAVATTGLRAVKALRTSLSTCSVAIGARMAAQATRRALADAAKPTEQSRAN